MVLRSGAGGMQGADVTRPKVISWPCTENERSLTAGVSAPGYAKTSPRTSLWRRVWCAAGREHQVEQGNTRRHTGTGQRPGCGSCCTSHKESYVIEEAA